MTESNTARRGLNRILFACTVLSLLNLPAVKEMITKNIVIVSMFSFYQQHETVLET